MFMWLCVSERERVCMCVCECVCLLRDLRAIPEWASVVLEQSLHGVL